MKSSGLTKAIQLGGVGGSETIGDPFVAEIDISYRAVFAVNTLLGLKSSWRCGLNLYRKFHVVKVGQASKVFVHIFPASFWSTMSAVSDEAFSLPLHL